MAEEDHQLHHCCWTGRIGEREEEEKEEEEEEEEEEDKLRLYTCHWRFGQSVLLFRLCLPRVQICQEVPFR